MFGGLVANRIVTVHLIGKTVRFSYLLGVDERSGKNFDHRKRRLEEKLKNLSANFGIDLLVFFCMSNQSSSAQVTARRRCDLGRGPQVPLHRFSIRIRQLSSLPLGIPTDFNPIGPKVVRWP